MWVKKITTNHLTFKPRPTLILHCIAAIFGCAMLLLPNTGQAACGDTVTFSVPSSVCLGSKITVSFSATNTAKDSLFRIIFGDGGDSTVSAAGNMDHTYSSSGKFYLKLIRTGKGNCKDTISDSIQVNAKPNTAFTLKQDSICSDAIDSFFATAGGLSNYTWRYGTGTTSSGQNTAQSFTNAGASPSSTTVKLVATNSSGCKDSLQKNITIMPFPTAAFSFTPDSACSGSSVSFTNSSTGAASYKWKFGDGTFSTSTNTTHAYIYTGNGFSTAAPYLVASTSSGCKDSLTRNLRVKQGPEGSIKCIPYNPYTLSYMNCKNNNYPIKISDSSTTSSTDSIKVISWGDGTTDTFASGFIDKFHTYASKGYFNLSVFTVAKNGCTFTKIYTVFNGSNPSVGLSNPGSTTNLCATANLFFPITNTTNNPPGTDYLVNSNDGNSQTFTQPPPDTVFWSFSISSCGYTSAGNVTDAFHIKITATNPCGTTYATVEPITLNKKPVANFGISPSDTVCLNSTVTFTDNSTNGSQLGNGGSGCTNTHYRLWNIKPITNWDTISSTTLGDPSSWNDPYSGIQGSSALQVKFKATGVYKIKLEVSNEFGTCGSDSITKQVVVVNPPIAAFHVNPGSGCINLTDTFVNTSTGVGNTYLWSVNPNSNFTYQNGTSDTSFKPIVRFTASGIYIVKLEVTNPCTTVVAYDTAKVKKPPTVSLPAISNGCKPYSISPSATYNANQGTITGYTWLFPGGSPTSKTTQNPGSIVYNTSGSFTVTAKATNECGTDSAQRSFTVFNLPTVNAGKSVDTLCLNQGNFTLTGYSPSGGTWTGTGVSSGGVFNTITSGVGTFTLKYFFTDGNGCTDTASKQVKVLNKPVVNFVFVNHCLDSAIQFTDSSTTPSSAISSRLWRFGDGSTSSSANPSHTYTASGNYTVTLIVTNSIGCIDSLSKTITVYPKPAVAYTVNNTPQCLIGNNFIFTNGTSISTGTVGYTWRFWDTASAFSSVTNPNHSYADTGSYNVKLLAVSDRGCRDSLTKQMKVLNGPSVSFTINDTDQCLSGNSFTFTDPSGSTSGLFWDFGNGNTSTSSGVKTQTYTPAGTYIVKFRISNGSGCTDSMLKTIVVKASPSPTFSFGASSFCAPQSISVSNSTSATPTVSAWKWKVIGTTGVTISNDTAKQPSFTFPDNQSGSDSTYTIRLLATSVDGCIDSSSQTITIKTRPKSIFTLGNDSCGSITVTANNTSLYASGYSWTVTPSTGVTVSNNTAANPVIGFPENYSGATISYTVKLVCTTTGGCLDSSTATIKVFRRPLARFTMSNTDSCGAITVFFSNTSTPAAGMIYSWDFGNGGNGTAKDTFITYTNPGVNDSSFSIKLIVKSAQGCFDDSTRTLNVWPDAKAVFTATNTAGCAPFVIDNSIITAQTFTNANSSYQWFANGTSIGTGSSFPGYTITNSNDSVLIKLKAISSKSCKNDSVETWFKTIQNPQPGFVRSDSVGCSPLQVLFVNTSTPSGLAYSWEFGNPSNSTNQTDSVYFTLTNAGTSDTTWKVKLVAKAGIGCKDSVTKTIVIKGHPAPSFSLGGSSFCAPKSITVSNTTGTTPTIAAWKWVMESSTGVIISNDTAKQPVFTFPDNKTGTDSNYTIWLKSTSVDGCFDSVSQSITIFTRPVSKFGIGNDSCGPITFTANDSSQFATGYTWTVSPASGVTISNNTDASPVIGLPENYSASTKAYTLKQVVNTANGCKDSSNQTINVYARPVARFTMSRTDSCGPITVYLTNTSTPSAGMIYSWDFGNGGNSTVKDTSIIFTTAGQNDSIYSLHLSVQSSFGCLDDTIRTLTIRPNAKAFFTAADSVGCAPYSIPSSKISASHFANANSQYKWFANATQLGGTQTGATLSFPGTSITNANDSITISLIAISKNACMNDTLRMKFKTIPNPQPNFVRSDTVGCHRFSVNFADSSIPSGGLGYFWDFGNGQTSTQQNPNGIVFTNTGNLDSVYTVKLVVSAGTGCKDSISKKIYVKPLPNPNFGKSADTLCNPGILTVTNSSTQTPSIVSYLWKMSGTGTSISNDTSSGSTQISFPDNQSGNYISYQTTLIATSSFGCKDSIEKPIVIPSRPIATCHASPDSSCGPKVFSITNLTQFGSTWSWSTTHKNITFSSKTVFEPTLSIPENLGTADSQYVVKLIATTIHGCKDSITDTVVVHPRPQAGFTADSIYSCGPVLVTFTNGSSGNTSLSYSWDFGDGGNSTGTNPTHTFQPSASQDSVYTVTLISSTVYGCTDTIQDIIKTKPSPTSKLGLSDTLICTYSGTPAQISIFNFSKGNVDTFYWDFGDGNLVNTASNSTQTHTYPNEGHFMVKLKTVNECNTSRDSMVVTVLEVPHVSFTLSDSITCDSFISIANTTTNSLQTGYISYLWDFGDGTTSTTVNPGVRGFLKNKTGKDSVYIIKLTAASLCDTITIVDSIKFRTIPYANFAPAKQFGCSPLVLKINNQSLGVDSNVNLAINYFVWEWGDSTQRDTTYNRSTFTHTYFTGKTDTFTIRMWAYNDCGVDSEQHDVIVYPNTIAPFVSINPANGMGCNPLTVNFTNNTTGANTFFWNFDSINTSNSRDVAWTFTTADSFSVAMTSSNGCSDTTIYIPIIVTDPPVVAFTDSGSHCSPADIYFNNTTTSATSYSWNFGDGDTSIAQNPVHTFLSTGTFKVLLLARNVNQYGLSCIDTVSRFVTIYAKPIAVLAVDTPKGCELFTPKFTASGSSFANNYLWSFGNGNTSTALSPAPTFTTAGRDTNYTVGLIVTNTNGCTDSTGTQVTVYAKPTANFSRSDSFACYPGTITFGNTSSFNAFTALWRFGDGDTSTSFNSVNHSYLKPGSYTPKLNITTIWSCKDSITKNIKIGGNDTLKVQTNDTVVCVGITVNLKCPISNPQGIVWNFGDGQTANTGSGVSTTTHKYTAAGNYTVTMTMTGPDGCVDSAIISIKINPLPTVDFSVNTSGQCLNAQNFVFTNNTTAGAGISGYQWKFGDGNTSTQTDPSKTYAASGVYTVNLIATTNQGCKDSSQYNVTVFPKPTPGFSINDSEQCINGNSFTFTSTSTISSGTVGYLIDFGDGSSQSFSGSNITHGYADSGTYIVKLKVISNTNCEDSISKKVYVRVKPTVSFNPNIYNFCLNGNIFQMVNTSTISIGTLGYQWSFGDAGTSTQTNPSHTYANNGTYSIKLKGISNFGCVDSSFQTVVVWPKPIPALGINDTNQCVNAQNFVFTNNTNIAYGSMTHEIDFGDGNRQAFTTATIGHSYASTGTYTVKIISLSDSGCIDSLARKIYVAPKPTVDFAINDTGQCLNGNQFVLDNQSSISAGTLSYVWYYGDGSSYATNAASPDGIRSYSTHNLFFATLKAISDLGCVDSSTKTLTVFPKPMPDFAINDSDQCLTANSFTFTNASSIAYGLMGFGIDFDDSTIQLFNTATIQHSYTHPDTFNVKLVAVSDLGCVDSIYKPVYVRPMPNMDFSVNDSQQCVNANEFQFTNGCNIGYGLLNYNWTFGNGDTSTLPNPKENYTVAGTYPVILTATSLFGCQNVLAKNITVHPKPQAIFTVSDSDNCVLLDMTFSNQSSSDVVGWTWDFGDPTSGNNLSNQASPAHTYLQTGIYIPQLIVENNFGCWDTVTGKMKVFPDPISLFTYSPKSACDTPVVVNFTNQSQGGVNYVWNLGNTKTSKQPHPFAIYTSTGFYPVTLTTYSVDGCVDSLTIVYIVAPEPLAQFDASPDSGCQDLTVQFTNTSKSSLLQLWDFGDGQGSKDTSPVHIYDQAGKFVPTLAVQNGNCRDTMVGDTITVWPKPVSDFVWAHIAGGGGEVKFSNLSQGSTSWLWDFDDASTSTKFDVQHRFGLHGSYLVTLVAFTNRFCTDTSEHPIHIDLMKGLWVGNAFTPEANSGDAMLFKPQGIGLDTFHVWVFTTWGELVWESTELENSRPKEGWNGLWKGLPCKADVYVWKIYAKFLDNTIWPGKTYENGEIQPVGTVTLIR